MRLCLISLAGLALCATTAHADTVTFTLSTPTVTVAPGSTLDVFATSFAPQTNTGVEYLNGIIETATPSLPGSSIDDANFFYTTYAPSLAPGDNFDGEIFSVLIPSSVAAGSIYNVAIGLQGGATDQSTDLLAQANLQIDVAPAAIAATPEPGSLMLLGSGTLAAALLFRKRLFSASTSSTTA